MRVLVCDDSMMFGALVEAWIASDERFTHVGTADDGAGILRLAETTEADALILDLVLPDVDDVGELVAGLRARRPQMRIVLLSSLPADELEIAARDAGADGFVHKMTSADQLLGALLPA